MLLFTACWLVTESTRSEQDAEVLFWKVDK